MQHRVELRARNSAAGDVVQHGEDARLERFGVFALAALDPARERRLAGAVVEPGELRRCGAELAGLELAAKRRAAVLEEHAREQARAHRLVRVPGPAEQPGHQVMGAGGGLGLVGGVAVEFAPRLREAVLVGDRHVDRPPFELLEGVALEGLLVPDRRKVAVRHEHRVGRVVLAGVEVAEHLPGERRGSRRGRRRCCGGR